MLEDYTILCYKYQWANSTDAKDVNFFSSVSPTLLSSISIKDYLIDISPINYNFEDTKFANYSNLIFKETSDVTLKVSGIRNNKYLESFFEITNDTSFVKFLVEVKNSRAELIYRGIVNQNSLSELFDDSANSEIINVTVLGFEKEFKAYYKEKHLTDEDSIVWEKNITIPTGANLPHPIIPVKKFGELLTNDLFDSSYVNFDIEDSIYYSYVSKIPNFYYSRADGLNSTKQVGTPQSANSDFCASVQGVKNQMLYTAAELTAAGFTAGDLSELQLFMDNDEPENGLNSINILKIGLKLTTDSTLTDFVSGCTNVMTKQQRVLDTVGQHWERFPFDVPFSWDGASNLIVEFCYYYKNLPSAKVYVQNSVSDKWVNKKLGVGNYGGCAETSGGTVQTTRPAVKMAIGSFSAEIGIFIKNGYDRLVEDGENCFEFLEKTCNAMGWHYSFIADKIVIKNIDSVNLTTQDLDYNDFINYNITKSTFRTVFNEIVIPDGEITCGVEVNPYEGLEDEISGKRIHLYTNDDNEISTMWFKYVTGTAGQRYALVSPAGHYFYKEGETENEKINWVKYYSPNEYSYTDTKYSLRKEDVLTIDAGENKTSYFVDCQTGSQGDLSSSAYTMEYSGNYGNLIIQLDVNGYLTENYLSYCKRRQFKSNFSRYFKSAQNVELEITYNGILYDYFKIFQVINGGDINGFYYITKLEIDLKNEVTKINLIKSLTNNT